LVVKTAASTLAVKDAKKNAFVFAGEFESVILQRVTQPEPVSSKVFAVPPF
jgi:hypothetical protein